MLLAKKEFEKPDKPIYLPPEVTTGAYFHWRGVFFP